MRVAKLHKTAAFGNMHVSALGDIPILFVEIIS